ncbi:MAG: lipase family protein [Spirochaetaceae bacterium]
MKLLKKTIPDPLKEESDVPNMDYIYFNNIDKYPFLPNEQCYSEVNAWWLSEASLLAYCHPGFVRMAFQLANFPVFNFFNGPGTECMVTSSADAVIIAFRGTETSSFSFFHELATDLNTFPVPFPQGGKVHNGFLDALNEVWEEKGKDYSKKNPKHNTGLRLYIEKLISEAEDRPIWICGHSLGGALATLCFAKIPQATGLYIFGAPRVGDEEFNKLLNNRPVFRIENSGDPIPLVPPKIPSINFNFVDTGELTYLDKNGAPLSSRNSLNNWNGLIDEDEIKSDEKKRELEIVESWKSLPKSFNELDQNIKQIRHHMKSSLKDWSEYLEEVYEELSPNIESHMPIYYTVKLWNILLKK